MKKAVAIIIEGIICFLLPTIFSYLGQSDFALDYLKNNNYLGSGVDISVLKEVCFFISIVLSFFLLYVNMICSKFNEQKYMKQSSELVRYNKRIFTETLVSNLGKEYNNINVRIFVPRQTLIWFMFHKICKNMKYEFAIKNVETLAYAGNTNDLKFEVNPNPEGLVGECYKKQIVIYDDDLEHSNATLYNLNKYQITKTDDLRFILVCPVFNDASDVIAIVAFDSTEEIKMPADEAKQTILRRTVLNYTQQLHENVPDLFKPKGGIF